MVYGCKDPDSMHLCVACFLLSNFFVNKKDSLIVSFGGA